MSDSASFESMWSALLPIGRNATTGGYRRYVWSDAERECRDWFTGEATARGLDVTTDRNGNLWAWWGDPDADPDRPGVVTGSHLDSVPDGGAYDGPLGVVSAFAALDRLRTQGIRPTRPLGIAAFADEEGARFGVACAGSRLLTGVLNPDRARALTDADGRTYADVLRAAGHEPAHLGRDDETLRRIGCFVELHIEQGRALAGFETEQPIAVGQAIWPHGRWRFEFTGVPDHAGTTSMADRRDPMLTYAMTALAANKRARTHDRTRATFGRVEVDPNSTNGIPSRVRAWLDARAETRELLDTLLREIEEQAAARARRDHTSLQIRLESRTDAVWFDAGLTDRIADTLGGVRGVPRLDTAAGHDAGILATAGIPTAMLYVRNPTGSSHTPAEYAEPADCLAGVDALTTTLAELLA